ncbi:PREDICTED: centromere protein I-like [Dinoponera quadriceps]|uniref:Centromere protein I-like n=1 Tax=Dinoponera quadriceps TaxID=609295 RepID=A0A6P3X6B7_DINQU|nr:PREDICTED: centromere protein I-like [Dinoponera quadriceps]
MTENETKQACLKFIKCLKEKNTFLEFDTHLNILQEEATKRGLDDDVLNSLVDIIINKSFRTSRRISLIKCLIPRYKLPEKIAKSMIIWCFSSLNELPITVCIIVIKWIIGLWDYELVDRKVINIYYDIFFYTMLKKPRLERDIARLIYVLTKPEDVSRREVSRLLALQKNYSKPPKHITALLSLFKSYKPELVPEKIDSVNIESVWKSIPEVVRLSLEEARERVDTVEIRSSQQSAQTHFNWNILQNQKGHKKKSTLLPSVGYFHIGSSIFKDKDAKSIFDISSTEELGKYHQSVELPCNAVSLLSNMAGYHLLTYADLQYQSRFSYNLYNTLARAFIWENGKFSSEEMDKLLAMTAEFSRYMQEGILVIKLFFDEYLYYNTGEYLLRLLDLLQWMTNVSIAELRENILMHVQNIFYESDLSMKCEIIKSLRKLIVNLFVRQGLEEHVTSSFLQQDPLENLADVVPVIAEIMKNLIVNGLNIHNYNVLLLSEALTFYEEICILESRSRIPSWTLPPSAVIYGAFITKSCAVLSRVCRLLLRYREMSPRLRHMMPSDVCEERIQVISIYANDIHRALWYNEPFSGRKNGDFLRGLSKKVIDDFKDCDLDSLLNISNHYAILSYKYTLSKMGLNINTKEDTMAMALCYFSAVNEFLAAFHE